MIYLDNGATTLYKPPGVYRAVAQALRSCGNPGRSGHKPAMDGARVVFACRQTAAELFDCQPEQVVFTSNCTHGLNMAIRSLIKPGDPVVISGFEHNAVTRPLYGLGAKIHVAGRKLFDPADTLTAFESTLRQGMKAAVITHISNVFGYILPMEELAALCHQYETPLIIDAAQSAGIEEISLRRFGAAFIAAPGHKGLLGPQGTGLLLCAQLPSPLLFGGTGSNSAQQQMPDFLPDAGEAGTLNVPGIAGLMQGMRYIQKRGMDRIRQAEQEVASFCAQGLAAMGIRVFSGTFQSGTVSCVTPGDCQVAADILGRKGIAVRAGLHCAPLAHESAGTLESGTLRVSFGADATIGQAAFFLRAMRQIVSDN